MKPQFITDDKGNKVGVILSIKDYAKLLDEVYEAHTTRMYDRAKSKKLTFRSFEEALKNIEQKNLNVKVYERSASNFSHYPNRHRRALQRTRLEPS